MKVTPAVDQGRQVIQSYGNGGFTVSGQIFASSIIITPIETMRWRVCEPAELTLASFEAGISLLSHSEVMLVGMGRVFDMLKPEIRLGLKNYGFVVEAMSTDAACRTYNVLMAEDRKVAAALIAV